MSQSIIYEAFLQAQSEFPEIEKDSIANAVKFSYKYASLPAIQRATFPILHANGIAVTQLFQGDALETRLVHTSGEYLTSLVECTDIGLTPQDFGKKITYYRRYALCAALGIAPDEDVDALGVDAPAKKKPKRADITTKSSDTKPTEQAEDDEWTSDIPDDIVDIVLENAKIIKSYVGDEKAKQWHTRALKNFLNIDKDAMKKGVIEVIKGLSREQLAEFAVIQNDKIKMNKED